MSGTNIKEKARIKQAKRRANLKKDQEKYKIYLEKDRECKAIWKSSLSPTQLDEHKLKERIRQRDHRTKAAAPSMCGPSTSSGPTTTYKSSQVLGKALKRAQSSLPVSPSRRLCVVQSLAKKVGLTDEGSPSSRSANSSHAINKETVKLVHSFYNNDISWQAPGRKDRIIIRETNSFGKKTKRTEQLRFLLMSLKEAY